MSAALKLTEADWQAIEREACKRSLATFVRQAWPHIIPDRIQWNWHIDAISEHLEAVARGEITRLLVNVPPGTSKSTIIGVMYPAWLWGPGGQPWHRYIGASHEQGLAVRDNRLMRELVTSDWYQSLWPTKLQGDQNEKLYFENEHRGFRQACAVASMTGRRGHTVAWDDPLSPEKAASEVSRETAIRVLRETVPTRLNDPATSAIVIVMQRLHENDPAGYILANELGYEHLLIPMEFEPDRRVTTSIGWTDPRKADGELLDATRFPPDVIERDKKIMGSYAWAGQMQQRPAPREGGMFKRGWFEVVDAAPASRRKVRRWDFAATEGAGDWTVGLLMSEHEGVYYVEDVVREQLSPAGVERLLVNTAKQDGKAVKVRIPQDPGAAGKSTAAHQIKLLAGYDARAELETGSKEVRANPVSAQAEAGNVKLVRGAWNDAFLDEVSMFPNGANDDQVDALSGAFASLLTMKVAPATINIGFASR